MRDCHYPSIYSGASFFVFSSAGSPTQKFPSVTVISTTLHAGISAGDGPALTSSANGASSNFTFVLNNRGSTTSITRLGMFAEGTTDGPVGWDNSSARPTEKNMLNLGLKTHDNSLPTGTVTSFTWFPEDPISEPIQKGQTYNYMIFLANSEIITGKVLAE